MTLFARGYIASGEFNGYRVPQHIQNQIVKAYCDTKDFNFVLSRAEYWINGSTKCQLWAALREGFTHIVFFSLWQLPTEDVERQSIYRHCLKNGISLHFAVERMIFDATQETIVDLEILIKTNLMILSNCPPSVHLEALARLV